MNKRISVIPLLFLIAVLGAFSLTSGQDTFSQGEINVREYPDIQSAVDALPPSGGVVYFPPGEYTVSEPIRLSRGEVTIRGAGPSTVIHNVNTAGGSTFILDGHTRQYTRRHPEEEVWRIQVTDMHLKGNEKSGHGIYAYNINEILIQNLWVDYHGLCGVMLDSCYENPRVADNNLAYNTIAGLKIDGCHDIVISANEFEENGIGIYTCNGFNTTVTGNNIDDHIGYGIYFSNMRGSIVTGNMVENGQDTHLVLDDRSDGTTVSGNIFRQNASGPGVWIKSAIGTSISSNTFEGCPDWGLRVEPGNSNCTVTGNTFSMIQFPDRPVDRPMDMVHGIRMDGVREITISGNTLVSVRRDGIAIRGDGNRFLTITGNTIIRPAESGDGQYSGIVLENVGDSIISSNTVFDDRTRPLMTYAILETGVCHDNIVTGNRVSRGRRGGIRVFGNRDIVRDNLIR